MLRGTKLLLEDPAWIIVQVRTRVSGRCQDGTDDLRLGSLSVARIVIESTSAGLSWFLSRTRVTFLLVTTDSAILVISIAITASPFRFTLLHSSSNFSLCLRSLPFALLLPPCLADPCCSLATPPGTPIGSSSNDTRSIRRVGHWLKMGGRWRGYESRKGRAYRILKGISYSLLRVAAPKKGRPESTTTIRERTKKKQDEARGLFTHHALSSLRRVPYGTGLISDR